MTTCFLMPLEFGGQKIAPNNRPEISLAPHAALRQQRPGSWRKAGLRFFAVIIILIACVADAFSALAPPRSLEEIVRSSELVAVVQVTKAKSSNGLLHATCTVLEPLKGTRKGDSLTIESNTVLAETARYQRDERCLVFLGKEGDHYETSTGMFGKYLVRDGMLLDWIVGRTRPANVPLDSVTADIQRIAGKEQK